MFLNVVIRIRVKSGGGTAQIYAMQVSIARITVAYHAKYVGESSENEFRNTLLSNDRTLFNSVLRRCEPKEYAGMSAWARC
mmetsp:Transcript_43082/g.52263  ORF Transcript_43082/g.52263 Transcript_43082/m.52263 type:complete len:81 (+) Transcript_43082:174-416(+)